MGVGSNPTSDNNLFLAFASSDSLMLNIIFQLKPVEDSRVAQWKRAGPITQRSVDRNHGLLKFLVVRMPPQRIYDDDTNRTAM